MKIFILALLLAHSAAYAWDNKDIESDSGYGYSSRSGGYKSSYGNTYQYDMSKSEDRRNYKYDYGAQIRDSVDVNPYKSLERGIGERGAGRKR